MRASSQYPTGQDIFLHLDGSPLVLDIDGTYSPKPEDSIYTEGVIPQTVEEAEALAHQILALCQDIREQRKENKCTS